MKKPITNWNQYRFQFVKEQLRKASFRWPPRGQALTAARTSQKINPATGRLCWYVLCAMCNNDMPTKEGRLDHVNPVVDPAMSSVWNNLGQQYSPEHLGTYVSRMLPEANGFQVLCEGCHTAKTRGENEQRKQHRQANKAAKGKTNLT